jgi:transglutaminase-like putative cysteine protease/tetratricopeptide (TPR) repeat protein
MRAPRAAALLLVLAPACKTPPAMAPVAPEVPAAPPPVLAPSSADESAYTLPVEVLEEKLHYSFDREGRRTLQRSLRYRILRMDDLGDWGQVVVYYRSGHQARPEIEASVRTSDGREEALDPGTIAESATHQAPELLDDGRVLRAPLPAVAKGSEVRYRITLRDTQPYFGGGSTERVLLGYWKQAVPTEVTVELPEGAPFSYLEHGVSVGPVERAVEGRRRLSFRYVPAPAGGPRAWLLPASASRGPELEFSTGRSWAEVAQIYAAEVEPLIAAADGRVGPEVPAGTSREALVGALLAWLHEQVRYTGLEFGRGAIVPRPPAETLRRGYGDCKDKATLLVAMLRARGVAAHVALVRAGHGPDVAPELPGVDAFNHAIVYLPGPSPLWVDATDDAASVGTVPASVQGRLSLVARPGVSALERVPESAPGADVYLERRVVRMGLGAPAGVEERTEARGTLAIQLRGTLGSAAPAELEKTLTAYVKRIYGGALGGVERRGRGPDVPAFEVELVAKDTDVGKVFSTEAEVELNVDVLLDWVPEQLKAATDDDDPAAEALKRRTEPLALRLPYRAELSYEVHPPPGFTVRALPRGEVVDLGAGAAISSAFSQEADGVVRAVFRFDAGPRLRTADEARAFVAGLTNFWKKKPAALAFDHEGARLMAGGQDQEGLRAHRALVERFPDNPYHHAALASALLKLGLGAQARQAVEAAVALAPEDPELLHRAGWVYSHDLFGGAYGPTFDPARAEAHYRAALARKPDAHQTRINLAILLQYGTHGIPLEDPARARRSAEEYARLLDTPRRADAAVPFLTSELMAGGAAEVDRRAEGMPPSADRDSAWVVAAALLRGVPAAVAEADARGWGELSREDVLSAAGTLAAELRRYDLAQALVQVAGHGTKEPLAYQRVASVYRKLAGAEALRATASEPERFVRELFAAGALGGVFRADFPQYVSSRAVSGAAVHELLAGFLMGARLARQRVEDAGFPALTAVDSAWVETRMEVTGDDRLGYRVKMLTGEKSQMCWFLVREQGKLRIRAVSFAPAELAGEALHRLAAGQLEAARTWLDWARSDAVGELWTLQQFRARWKDGAERGPKALREAAAILLTLGPEVPKDAVGALRAIYAEARRTRPEVAGTYARLLFRGLAGAGEPQAALRLLDEEPDLAQDMAVLEVRFGARVAVAAWPALEADAGAVLASLPGHAQGQLALVRAAAHTGRLPEAQAKLEGILAERPGQADAPFALLWSAVLQGTVQDRDLDRVAQATEGALKVPSHLQALGLAYAELGRPREAMQALRRLAEVRQVGEVEPEDRFVLGRVLEGLGYAEPARAAYQVTLAAPRPDALALAYARRRLAGLSHPSTKGGRGKH